MSETVIPLIIETLRELQAKKGSMPRELNAETPLFGPDGILDSLALVSLVVGVEQAIEDEFGMVVSLADEKALSQRNSPYRTIGALAEYASQAIYSQIPHG
jgi:acyl carrier protein